LQANDLVRQFLDTPCHVLPPAADPARW